jgi:hypothetical protein
MTIGDGVAIGSCIMAATLLALNGAPWWAAGASLFALWCAVSAVFCKIAEMNIAQGRRGAVLLTKMPGARSGDIPQAH